MKLSNLFKISIGVILLVFIVSLFSSLTGVNPIYVAAGVVTIGALSNIPAGSLAFTSFATQLLRDVIRDHSTLDMNKGQQKFEMRTNEIAVMNTYYGMREKTLTPADIAFIENLRTGEQAIDLFLYNKRAVGAGTTRVRKGTGSSTIATVVPTFFSPIQEGLDLSFVNQAIRQYGSEGADKKSIIAAAYQDHLMKELPQIFRNIYTRANIQYVAHLEANKWALTGTADEGTIFTTVTGDAKNVPNTVALTEIIQNMQIEARQNNFLQLGRPTFITSPTAARIINEYLARGQSNEIDVKQFLGWFDWMVDNEIIDAAGDDATFFEVADGGLAGYSRTFPWESHPDAVGGIVNTGEDEWSNLTIGGADTNIFTNLPPINLEVKTFRGFTDTSGTVPGAPDESKIDIVQNFSFVVEFGALRAFDADSNISPILKYIVKT